MEENLKMLNLRVFVMSKELNIHFQLLELPNKMGLLKGKIEPCKKWLHENNLPNYFWAEAVNTSCYILNRVLIRSSLNFGKTRNLTLAISKFLEVNALF